ncbi:hypothetical protein T484DRAFT_1798470 [Baffinella frigidus]|nr:hypothetical protein T484DRAFT_1798470 [Cryptophyta sp. CCMP2293]
MAAATRDPVLWEEALNGRKEQVLRLLTEGEDIDGRGGPMRASPLHYAVLSGHRAIVRLLLENGANVSSKDYAGSTPEAWAYASRHLGFAKMLQAEAARLAPRPSNAGKSPEDVATARSQPHITAMIQAEVASRAVAFAMGQQFKQERLGAESWVQELDAGVVRMVLEHV